jgi:Family of unknown function (DUF5984)
VIRFRFRLRPITEVSPWGPDRRLHWSGLTDGWYWIEIDGLELLRYAPQTGRTWIGDGPAAPTSYVDYYVVRLWEDVLDLLPAVLEPVPDDLAELMSSDPGNWVSLDEAHTEAAADWHGSHALDMSYLRCPPSIRWWRRIVDSHDHTIVAWQHESGEIEFTAPRNGHATMPTSEFVGAVEELDRELLAAMEERIAELEGSGPTPGVHIDMQQLRAGHQYRATWLQRRRTQAPATDWTEVRIGAGILLGH